MVVEITVVEFKQLRTTTPRKKNKMNDHNYTLQQINTLRIQNVKYDFGTAPEISPY